MHISPELWRRQHLVRAAALHEIRAWAEVARVHAEEVQQRAIQTRTRAAALKQEAQALRARRDPQR